MEFEELRKIGPRRKCSGCTACCYVMPVAEIPCGFREACPFALPGVGCTIWGRTPAVCRPYQCLWLAGFGEEDDRPDLSGVLVDLRLNDEGEFRIVAIGVHEGDEDSLEARQAMENIARDTGQPVHLSDTMMETLEVIDDGSNGSGS